MFPPVFVRSPQMQRILPQNPRISPWNSRVSPRNSHGFPQFPRRVAALPFFSTPAMKDFPRYALAVDAACSGNPGPMEYRGVLLFDGQPTGRVVFRYGPVYGTNNIGEFLAVVHALALLERKGYTMDIYTDSQTAQAWVRNMKAKTTLERTPATEPLYQLIGRAETWLRTHAFRVPIRKWDTSAMGEIPADFGRK